MSKLIDVSQWNGMIDWAKVKKAGIDGAIIRTGFGRESASQIDKQFETNYKGAKAVGLNVGAYHYSYATTVADALLEADFVVKLLKGKQFEFPIYFDIEEKCHVALTKTECDNIVIAFCSKLEKAGYWCGVYSFDSFFFIAPLNSHCTAFYGVDSKRVENIKPTYCKAYGMWQYSWLGFVDGIKGEVDMNICYKDFPTTIKANRLNGFGREETCTITAVKTGVTVSEGEKNKKSACHRWVYC